MHKPSRQYGGTWPRLAWLALCLGCLGTSCQSVRMGYAWQLIPSTTARPADLAPYTPTTANTAPQPATAMARTAPVMATTPRARRTFQASQQHRRHVGTQRQQAIVSRRPHILTRVPARLRVAPQAPAETGLGTTVFGILGLLALPIGLIGLALGGGLVWAIIAGAGALAVLVAWLDPFG